MEEIKPPKIENKINVPEPWAEAELKAEKITEQELEVYNYIFSEHTKVIPFLKGDADKRQMDDQAFLRRIYSNASKTFGLGEKEAEMTFYRLEILRVNYRPSSNVDFSPEAIEQNMPRYLEYYRECRKSMIVGAAMNRDHAVSWRPEQFKVGCTALTLDADLPDDQPAIHPGANYKPTKESKTRCAEKHAVEGAILYNTKLIIAITIVSKESTTGDPSKSCGALHPCLECRRMYRDLLKKGILREDSIICSANDSELDEEGMPSVIQEMSVKELLDLYKDDPEE
ncbi:MAG: hypothetical protein Q8L10_04595 [Candidatus Moranbacteria bacterium]|nr:hypothetical protein [Candidatus Moranbacteria bacterium]